MSLINKMLQDLDARGGQPGLAAVSSEIRTVLAPERRFPWLRVALLGGLAAVLGGSGYLAWRLQGANAAPAAAQPPPAALLAPAPKAPVPADAPLLVQQPAAVPVPEAVVQAPAQASVDLPAPEPVKAAPQAPRKALREKPAKAARVEPKKVAAAAKEAPRKRDAVKPAAVQPAAAAPVPAKVAARPAAPAKASAGRVETTAQRAENGYRRALASLEDGRVTEAVGHLQGALRADPKHEASRQTLVSLLVEARRPDEAIRQLQAALALDPRQPSMAMLLARLQIENGASGIETLLRTLPYAAGNGEYHAFLAGALQRDGRHREAAEHYGAALRTAPQNGVWWMGLGISLQADKRNAEAMDAFQKARSSGTLSAELQGFVERKLKQLAR